MFKDFTGVSLVVSFPAKDHQGKLVVRISRCVLKCALTLGLHTEMVSRRSPIL